MQGMSTRLQLLCVINDLLEALKSKTILDIIYLEFMKAFDIVPNERLLYKVSRYVTKYPLYSWIRSFLTIGHNL